jgi:hypothetical protein
MTCHNKRVRDDFEEPTFNQIIMMISTQQVNEQEERQADREEECEECL